MTKSQSYKKVYFGMNGQYGDIIMQEPGLRQFISDNPHTKIVLGCSKKYEDILPLFHNYHPNIVEYKIWEGYDDWPTKADSEYIKSQNFDAMFPNQKPFHPDPDWPQKRHITIETALVLGVTASTANIELKMPEGVVKEPKTVAIHMFSSKWPGGTRSISVERQNIIVNHLHVNGYKIYQLSAPHQPHITNTHFVKGTYLESCKKMLSTDFLITCDSGMAWVASAYNHPMVGLYSTSYDPRINTTENWQPVNPNAVYLEGAMINNISMYYIMDEINKKIQETV